MQLTVDGGSAADCPPSPLRAQAAAVSHGAAVHALSGHDASVRAPRATCNLLLLLRAQSAHHSP